MALTLSVDTARSSLSATSEQISVVSRNIARVGDADATRKTALIVSGPGAGVSIAGISRSSDQAPSRHLPERKFKQPVSNRHHDGARPAPEHRRRYQSRTLARCPDLKAQLRVAELFGHATELRSCGYRRVGGEGRGKCAQFRIRHGHRCAPAGRFRHRDIRRQHQ